MWTVLEEGDALAYTEEKCLSSAGSVGADVQKGILKQGNTSTTVFLEAFVQEHTVDEGCVSGGRVTQPALCMGHSSKDETTTERPYKEIIKNTEKSQSIEENRPNASAEDTYSYPTYYLNKKESEITLNPSAEETEASGEDTERSESDDPLEECRRIFYEFEREAQKKGGDEKVHKEVVPFKASPWQQGHDAKIQQGYWETVKSAAAAERGQAFIATTSEEKKSTSGFSSTQFGSVTPMASSNLLEVKPLETCSGQLCVLLGGNVATATPHGLHINSFKSTILVPCKTSTQRGPSISQSRSKVPLETRHRYINIFFAECFKSCSTVNEAINKALMEEQSIYDRCGSKKMYLNFAARTLKKLRDHGQLSNSISSSGAGSSQMMRKSNDEEAFTGSALYKLLKDYLLTEEQLKENNFPRPNPKKNGSAILTGVVKNAGCDDFKRVCCRCGKVYAVTSTGEHRRKEECNYHSGSVLEQKVPGGVEKCYSCCERIVGSAGCQIAKLHVHDGRGKKLEGFMKTLIKSPPFDRNYGVYALDCETCYTTRGVELTRVTVVDAKLQVVYDTFVKPDGKIIDYDIRLSGAMEDDLKNTTTSLRDVQAILLNLFSAETILIGHSLENNLYALKLIHGTVVDTSIVFPHRLGLPHKRALGSLMADYLRRIHQDDVGGHNSRNNAVACMELILWKVKEDKKRRKR
nr:RNA exonuclease 1 homolog isoform X2 [Columba livia]